MSTFFKILAAGYILLFIFALSIRVSMKEVEVKGVIIEKNVSSDRNGNLSYFTLIRCEDGSISEEKGFYFYTKNVGDTVYLTIEKSPF